MCFTAHLDGVFVDDCKDHGALVADTQGAEVQDGVVVQGVHPTLRQKAAEVPVSLSNRAICSNSTATEARSPFWSDIKEHNYRTGERFSITTARQTLRLIRAFTLECDWLRRHHL